MYVKDLVVNRTGPINNERLERANAMIKEITDLLNTM